jgi:hypothetical protein
MGGNERKYSKLEASQKIVLLADVSESCNCADI